MLIHKLTIFVIIFCLGACTTAESTQTASDTPGDAPQEINWAQAKEMIFSGEIVTIVQAHDRKVILQDKDGNQFIMIEPELDNVIETAKQCGAKCSNMDIMTE